MKSIAGDPAMIESSRVKSALVAGGTGGLGRAVSLDFLNKGAAVHVTYRNEAEFSSLQSAAGNFASFLHGYRVDVTSERETTALLQQIGRVGTLVNTVGGYAGGTPLWQTTVDVFERMMTLNLRSGFLLAHAVVPVMLAQKSGVIINISSRAAIDHAAGASVYAASKAAAVAMMDSLAADVLGTGIRVNTILPSIIDTPANRSAMPTADFSKWPTPEDVAAVILFLASDEARLIHGASIPVYGAN
jgi:NAD(P)-dependent dehydrogenase (short-subunit alcohol dehydrogenase family)